MISRGPGSKAALRTPSERWLSHLNLSAWRDMLWPTIKNFQKAADFRLDFVPQESVSVGAPTTNSGAPAPFRWPGLQPVGATYRSSQTEGAQDDQYD